MNTSQAAFYIQSWFRHRKIKNQKPPIKLYFTSITGQSHIIKQNLHRVSLLLDLKGWPIDKVDIVYDKQASQFAQEYRMRGHELPLIFIHGIFIGGADQLQELEDNDLLDEIYNKSYENRCLVCNNDRQTQIQCIECNRPFLFFQKS